MDGPIVFILSNLPGLVALVIAFMLGTAVEQYRVKVRRAEWRLKHGPKYHTAGTTSRHDGSPKSGVDFSAGQLSKVSRAKFSSRPLLNKSEANVFVALDKAVIARNPRWQVMAQVSLGEFLIRTGNSAAARDAVNKEARRKAGIGYHEVVARHMTAGELRALVGKLVPGGRVWGFWMCD